MMPGPLKNWKLPKKPIVVVGLSQEGMLLSKQSKNPGLIAFCGQFGAKPVDYDLALYGKLLVQVQTVNPYHGWTADIQAGVDYIVLSWPHTPPKWYQLLGHLDTQRVRPFPIPHHLFRPFNLESSHPDNGVEAPKPYVVRP